MKYIVIFSLIFALFILPHKATSQVKVDVKGKVISEADNRANNAADRAIDAGFNAIEEGIKGAFKKKDKKEKNNPARDEEQGKETENEDVADDADVTGKKSDAKSSPVLSWSKYDFVPGDQIIFEDNLANEQNGEFPSRWDLYKGTAENAVLNGENVIMFREYNSEIVPYMKDPESDYLPDIFTVEFDAYIPDDYIEVYFYDMKNQSAPSKHEMLYIKGYGMELRPAQSELPEKENLEKQWMHVAIAYTSGKLKAYINETRLINIPRLGFEPTGISIRALHSSDESKYYIKNIRIAKGGVKYYDRVLQDGRIIANGIRFDVNKAALRPESMGVINEIVTLMKEHPEIKFSVEGHTDSDGDDSFNQTLSEQRAETVLNTLVNMGIEKSRLTSKGWGESKPIDTNGTPEGKANNRRVEFVKI